MPEQELWRLRGPDWTSLRRVPDDEASAIEDALSFCRRHARRLPIQLVLRGRAAIDQAVKNASDPAAANMLPIAVENIQVALVSWLFLWRLFLDHTAHDLSMRFGATSDVAEAFAARMSEMYDRHAGYRLVEGLRNYTQHVELPGVLVTQNQRRGDVLAGEAPVVVDLEVRLPVNGLLSWASCPSTLRRDLKADPTDRPVLALIDDAMTGFRALVSHVIATNVVEMGEHIALLHGLCAEVGADATPALCTAVPTGAGGLRLSMVRMDDVMPFLALAPTP